MATKSDGVAESPVIHKETKIVERKGTNPIIWILAGCGGCALIVVLIAVAIMFATINTAREVAKEVQEQSEFGLDELNRIVEDGTTIYQTGEQASVGNLTWMVESTKDMGNRLEPDFALQEPCLSDSGTFLRVTVNIENNGPEKVVVTDGKLLDDEGNVYVSSKDIYRCLTDEIALFDAINPGLANTYNMYFEVPTDSVGLKLEVTDHFIFPQEVAFIDLGL